MDQFLTSLGQAGLFGTVISLILRFAIPFAAKEWSKMQENIAQISEASIVLTTAAAELTKASESLVAYVDKLTAINKL